jgi:hypothetical protein
MIKSNYFGLCLGCTTFESWLGQQLSWRRFCKVFLTYSRYQDKCFKLSFDLYLFNNQHNTLTHYFILQFCITCYFLLRNTTRVITIRCFSWYITLMLHHTSCSFPINTWLIPTNQFRSILAHTQSTFKVRLLNVFTYTFIALPEMILSYIISNSMVTKHLHTWHRKYQSNFAQTLGFYPRNSTNCIFYRDVYIILIVF